MSFLPSQAPQCLQQFGTRRVEPTEAGLPIDASFNSYRIACPCGSDVWRVHGYAILDGREFDEPIDLECSLCHETSRLIDRERDGYDGEIGGLETAQAAQKTCGSVRSATTPMDIWLCRLVINSSHLPTMSPWQAVHRIFSTHSRCGTFA